MIDYEVELLAEIEALTKAKDYEGLKTAMAELISYQKTLPIEGFTDEELAEKGVDLVLLQQERELAKNIKQAEQDGDFVTSLQLRRDLVVVQRNQPRIRGLE